ACHKPLDALGVFDARHSRNGNRTLYNGRIAAKRRTERRGVLFAPRLRLGADCALGRDLVPGLPWTAVDRPVGVCLRKPPPGIDLRRSAPRARAWGGRGAHTFALRYAVRSAQLNGLALWLHQGEAGKWVDRTLMGRPWTRKLDLVCGD